MNILYICTPHTFHDLKWISFFSERKEIKQFVIWEKTYDSYLDQSWLNSFKEKNIMVLSSYPSFSIQHFAITFKTIRNLNKLIDLHKIDIVHILFATPHALYSSFLRARVVLTTRGSDILKVIPALKQSKGYRIVQDKILFYFFKKAFLKATAITCTSTKQIDNITLLFNRTRDTFLIRTGVDVERIRNLDANKFLPECLTGIKFIFSARYMSPVYNMETQIAAIRMLRKDILAKYTFVFIRGKDPYYSRMKTELERTEGLKFIIFDRLTQEEMWACFKKAILAFMIPYSDGTPNTALEAMAVGCRLIMGDADYDSVLFENVCITVSKTDARQLAQAIETSIQSYPEDLLEKAMRNVNQYGNRTTEMNKVLQLYFDVFKAPVN